jgi:RHS family protein
MLWITGIEGENFFCQKLPEVRSWMRDSNNYRLEKGAGKGGNFSRGAQN